MGGSPFSRKFLLPLPKPTPSSSKAFDFIESLLSVFPADGKRPRLMIPNSGGASLLNNHSEAFPTFQFPLERTPFARPLPHQSKFLREGPGKAFQKSSLPSSLLFYSL